MSLARRVVQNSSSMLQAALPPSDTLRLRDPFIAAPTAAGVMVTEETALFLTVVLACIQVVVDAITEMPLLTYQRTNDKRRQVEVPNAWQAVLLDDEPNPEMDAAQMWGDVISHCCMDWNAFIGKTFDLRGKVKELWPIRPDFVRIERRNGIKIFHVRDEYGAWFEYTSKEIIHVRCGYSLDGLRSVSPIKLAAQQIGAGIAMERFMNEFWKNGAMYTAALTTANELGDERAKALANRFHRAYRNRRRGVVVLEEGVKLEPLQWNHVDSQFMEQKRELVESIARVWRIPLGKLMSQVSGSSQTYRNQEQERYELYGDAVLPKGIRIERALSRDRDLFPRTSAPRQFCQFDADEVLRADSITRARVQQIRTGGAPWWTTDEARDQDGMEPNPALLEKQASMPITVVTSATGTT